MQNIVAAAPCAAEPDDTATLNFPIVRINTNECLPLLFILQPLATLHFQQQLFQCPISELSSEMKFILLFFWILSLLHGAVEDRARVFSLYNSSHIQPDSRRSLRLCKYQNSSNYFHLILLYFCRYRSLFLLGTRIFIAPHTSFKTSHGKSSCVPSPGR